MDGINKLFASTYGQNPESITEIPCSVSSRRYFRLIGKDITLIGTYSPDIRETKTFTTFARHFLNRGINVPEIIAVSKDMEYYLQTDMGNLRLHELVLNRSTESLDHANMLRYKKALEELVKIQIDGYKDLDFSICVPRPAFDHQAILWDLNHFKYYFLKPLGIPFDENLLEESFFDYANYLEQLPNDSFMFRDFQTRNIMLHDEEPYLIDFQGGRKGPVQYDLASILFEAKAGLTEADRVALLNYYLSVMDNYRPMEREVFLKEFYAVTLIRILQVLGTYGLRGMVEKKAVFLQSIPNGLKNLDYVLQKLDSNLISVYFKELLEQLVERAGDFKSIPQKFDGLTIQITSFSYRKPLPDDLSGNGGGFVYDCRFLNNPGRHESIKHLTGLDAEVKAFLQTKSDADKFVESIKEQLNTVLESYYQRKYSNLMISFGCTGGRHRSVYTARAIADWCRGQKELRIIESHRELGLEF